MRQITQLQLYMMFSIYLFTSTLGLYANYVVKSSLYMTWISIILGGCLSLVISCMSIRLARRRPDQYFGDYGKTIVGKWVHYPLLIFLIVGLMFTTGFIMHDLEDFIIQVYLPGTPNWAIGALFSLCFVAAVRCGIETIFRSAQGIFFISVLGVLITPFFVKEEMNTEMLLALVNRFDFRQTWNGMWANASLFGETAFLLYIFPKISNFEKTMKTVIWATFSAVLIILTNIVPAILIFGPELMSYLSYPELELIRYIHASAFFENLDPVLIALWITGLFIKISFLFYLVIINLSHLFSLKDHRPLTLSTVLLVTCVSLFIVESTAETNQVIISSLIALVITLELIPVLYLLVDRIRSGRKKAHPQADEGRG